MRSKRTSFRFLYLIKKKHLYILYYISSSRRKEIDTRPLSILFKSSIQQRDDKYHRLLRTDAFMRLLQRYIPLGAAHQRRNLGWCKEQKDWKSDQWNPVLFTDGVISQAILNRGRNTVLSWKHHGGKTVTVVMACPSGEAL